MNFDSNSTKNDFVLEDGTIVTSEEDHVVLAIPSIPA